MKAPIGLGLMLGPQECAMSTRCTHSLQDAHASNVPRASGRCCRRRDVRVRRHEQHVRERHPHVELLRAVPVAERRLLDGALGSWPAPDPPGSARRRAMRAVDHRTVRSIKLRASPLAPCPRLRRAFWQRSKLELGAEWRRAGERRELPIAEGTVSLNPRVILPPQNCSPYIITYTYISMYLYKCVYTVFFLYVSV
jgi:hypothetical protein